jgi:hypothetical protein
MKSFYNYFQNKNRFEVISFIGMPRDNLNHFSHQGSVSKS